MAHEIDAARFMKSAVLSGIGHTILPWGQLEDVLADIVTGLVKEGMWSAQPYFPFLDKLAALP